MSSLFSWESFAGFGPNPWDPGPLAWQRIHGSRSAGLRHRVREHCPRRPGVYGMIDGDGELIYVGKARCLRTRLLSYFRPKGRDRKAGRIIGAARAIAWEYAPSEFAALLRELDLIRRWRPRWNVHGQPGRLRLTYVCLGRRPAAHVYLSRRPAADVLACFGPIAAGKRAAAAVSRVNDWFQLRDCPQPQEMIFADPVELFPAERAAGCIRHEIGTCLGPCAAACTRQGYAVQVRSARAFLEGQDRTPLAALNQAMTAAAAALQFERAAALRDRLESLQWLVERLDRLRQARREQSFVYPVHGRDGHDLWYLIHGGRVVHVLPRPRDEAQRQATAAAIRDVYDGPFPRDGLLRATELDSVWLVATWFRRRPAERLRVLEPAAARSRLETG